MLRLDQINFYPKAWLNMLRLKIYNFQLINVAKNAASKEKKYIYISPKQHFIARQ